METFVLVFADEQASDRVEGQVCGRGARVEADRSRGWPCKGFVRTAVCLT